MHEGVGEEGAAKLLSTRFLVEVYQSLDDFVEQLFFVLTYQIKMSLLILKVFDINARNC